MQLGVFSISLTVKDLMASKAFYEKLGFDSMGGDPSHNYLIMRNSEGVIIGLFQGMFDKNILTFNPGWDNLAQNVDPFTDVREIHQSLKDAGLETVNPTNMEGTGPASFVVVDPDGNPILIDQHR